MAPDERNVFGEYAPEPQTAATTVATEVDQADEVDIKKYGIGKPRRIIVRGTVAADSGIEEKRK